MILHLAQRGLTDAFTFMLLLSALSITCRLCVWCALRSHLPRSNLYAIAATLAALRALLSGLLSNHKAKAVSLLYRLG